jgi:hypothetical protein
MRHWWRSWRQTYLAVDPRSLGLFRVVFGIVLLSDLARRWWELEFWYTNSGLLPNHTLLWRPPSGHMFSLFFTASTVGEARLGFALCTAAYLLLLLGYQTRLAQVLALVARVSLNSRLALLENGGDMVMDLLCLLTLPLPLGTRFSLDAVRRGDTSVEQEQKPVASLAVLALLLQFSAIYFFNAISKDGAAWRDGSAVHYALHQDKLVTWLGVWMRERLPAEVLRWLTWGTLTTEWLGFALILTPVFVRQARALAVCVMPLLHLGFALGLNLGGFSPAMMSFFPLLLGAAHWKFLARHCGAVAAKASAACERVARRVVAGAGVRQAPPSPLARMAGEAFVALLLVAIASEALNDNASVPRAWRVKQPDWAKAVIEYPRILQGWRMFASEPPRGDTMIYVTATTAAGKRIDPYNEVASDQPFPAAQIVPRHMGQSQFFVMYSERIANPNYAAYRSAFSEWLLAYPTRTLRPNDCLLAYEVFFVSDHSPELGSQEQAKPAERRRFMSYTAPHDSPCRALAKEQRPKGPAVSGL